MSEKLPTPSHLPSPSDAASAAPLFGIQPPPAPDSPLDAATATPDSLTDTAATPMDAPVAPDSPLDAAAAAPDSLTDTGAAAPSPPPRQRRILSRLAVAVILLTIFVLAGGSYTLAKYVQEWAVSLTAEPAAFCLSSDYLQPGGASYTLYDWSDFTVRLYNFQGLNHAETNISYSVALSGSGAANYTDPGSGTLTYASGQETNALTITPTAPSAGQTVIVTVTTSAPYSQTLSATFTMASANGSSYYRYTDNGATGTLTIHTGSSAGPTTISWNGANLAADNTNPLVGTNGGSSVTPTLAPNALYTITFFENISGNYGTGDTVFTNAISLQ